MRQSRGYNAVAKQQGRNFQFIGQMAKYAGISVAGFASYGLVSAIKEGANFEQQMSSLGAVLDLHGRRLDRLRDQAIAQGRATKFSATEAAAAQAELAKGGLDASQILGGALQSALSLAAAGELDLAQAAGTTVNAIKLFKLEAKDAPRVADALATAANTTTADVADFAMALTQGGSAAKQAGLQFNDTVVILEALAEIGVKNSDAGTSMKAALIQLLAPSAKQAELASQLNIELVDQQGHLKNATGLSHELREATEGMTDAERAKTFAVLAGTDGFRTLSALYDAGPGKLRRLARANLEVGTAQDVARQKTHNVAGAWERFTGSIETVEVSLFQHFQRPIRETLDDAASLVNTKGREIEDFFDNVVSTPEFRRGDLSDKINAIFDELDRRGAGGSISEMITNGIEAGFEGGVPIVTRSIPLLAEAAGKGAGQIAISFTEGFFESDALGKLVLGAWFIKTLGGWESFRYLGGRAGATTGAAIAASTAATTATAIERGPFRARVGGALRRVGGAVGPTAGIILGTSILSAAMQTIGNVRDMPGGTSAAEAGLNDFVINWGRQFGLDLGDTAGEQITAKINENVGSFFRTGLAITGEGFAEGIRNDPEGWEALAPSEQDALRLANLTGRRLRRAFHAQGRRIGEEDLLGFQGLFKKDPEGFSDMIAAWTRDMRVLRSGTLRDWGDIQHILRRSNRNIQRDPNMSGSRSRRLIQLNFDAARDAVVAAWRDQEITTKQKAKLITQLTVREMETVGDQPARLAGRWARGWDRVGRITDDNLDQMVKHMDRMPPKAQRIFGQTLIDAARELDRKGEIPTDSVDRLISKMAKRFGILPDKARTKIGPTAGVFQDLNKTVGGVLGNIFDNLRGALDSLNVDASADFTPSYSELAAFGGFGRQRGGPMFGGKPSGDSIPAVLEREEYVLNRNAARFIGRDTLDHINFSVAPRFQRGGAPTLTGPEPLRSMGAESIDRTWKAATDFLKAHRPVAHAGGAGFASAEGPRGSGPVMQNIREAIALARQFGAGVSDLYRPGADSFHNPDYSPPHQAVDLSPPSMGLAKSLIKAFGVKNILELFYEPLGFSIDNYATTSYIEPDHTDHIHLAFQRGGDVRSAKRGRGGPRAKSSILSGPAISDRTNINKKWPTVISDSNWGAWAELPHLQPYVAAALIEAAGDYIGKSVPGWTMEQISLGEGVLKPGSRSGDGGWGPWAITSPYGSSYGVTALGGYPEMANPVKNAYVAARMFDPSTAFGPTWHGDQYVTDRNRHYDGKYDIRKSLGGKTFAQALKGQGAAGEAQKRLLLIGDSHAKATTGWPGGWKVDAEVGRNSTEGLRVLKRRLGEGISRVVFDLGTNDFTQPDRLKRNLGAVSKLVGKRDLTFVETFLSDGRAKAATDAIRTVGDNKDVDVVPWYRVAANNPEWLKSDGIHFTSEGYAHRRKMIENTAEGQGGGTTAAETKREQALKRKEQRERELKRRKRLISAYTDPAKKLDAYFDVMRYYAQWGAWPGEDAEESKLGKKFLGTIGDAADDLNPQTALRKMGNLGALLSEHLELSGHASLKPKESLIHEFGREMRQGHRRGRRHRGLVFGALRTAGLAQPFREKLHGIQRNLDVLSEKTDHEESWAVSPAGPNGTDYSTGELADIIGLWSQTRTVLQQKRDILEAIQGQLRGRLHRLSDLIKEARPVTSKTHWRLRPLIANRSAAQGLLKNTVWPQLIETVGRTGRGGLLDSANLRLAELGVEKAGGSTGDIMDIEGLRDLLQAARYGVFDSRLQEPPDAGIYHTGGIVNDERRITAKLGEGIFTEDQMEAMGAEMGGRDEPREVKVRNEVSWDGLGLLIKTFVNDQLELRERHLANAHRAGAPA